MERVMEALRNQGFQTGSNFRTGRPDRWTISLLTKTGTPLVAKFFPSGGGDVTYDNMRKLWASRFGETRNPPGLPRPVDYLPDLKVLIMEKVEGRPLVEQHGLTSESIEKAIYLLIDLHQCDAQPVKKRDPKRIVRSIFRKAEEVLPIAPASARYLFQIAECLKSMELEQRELVPSHGDFSPRNIFLTPKRICFIDWDRFQWADRLRDVAYLGIWCWSWALRQRQTADWSVLERAVQLYDSLQPGSHDEKYLRFHLAAGLARVAHGLIRLWPDDAYLVPSLAAEALRWLE